VEKFESVRGGWIRYRAQVDYQMRMQTSSGKQGLSAEQGYYGT
jgi:hypothetical protein